MVLKFRLDNLDNDIEVFNRKRLTPTCIYTTVCSHVTLLMSALYIARNTVYKK